jgi:hypothetical protein
MFDFLKVFLFFEKQEFNSFTITPSIRDENTIGVYKIMKEIEEKNEEFHKGIYETEILLLKLDTIEMINEKCLGFLLIFLILILILFYFY